MRRIKWYWHKGSWAFGVINRFNSGNPYTSYRFGPIEIRKGWYI